MKKNEKIFFEMFGKKVKGTIIKPYDGGAWVKANMRSIWVPEEKMEFLDKVVSKKRLSTRIAPTASDYKLFSDTCFEMAQRWKGNWISVISGKWMQKGAYDKCHGGHFISRANWNTRHYPMNCHPITAGENFAMSRGCVKTITAYKDFLIKKYGQQKYDIMIELSAKPSPRLTIPFLQDSCRVCWNMLAEQIDAPKELKNRIASWPKAKRDKINRVKEFLEL